MSLADKTSLIKQIAADHGCDRVGIVEAGPVRHAPYLKQWLAQGRAGTMDYLHRNENIRSDPSKLLDGACSVIVMAFIYHQESPPAPDRTSSGRIAMYAWGDDYHEVIKKRLHAIADELHKRIDEPFTTRCCVDTVPILERELAAAAGIGWIGKNTMVLHQDTGSYFFLGEIVTTLKLRTDEPAADHCGTCTRCLDACPTDAFPAPYEMDASRCISYLTIEHRRDIPSDFHEAIGNWIFGCDVCQEVCPYNQEAPISTIFHIREPGPRPDLDEISGWSDADYRRILKSSAIRRVKLPMLKRNAEIASQNAR